VGLLLICPHCQAKVPLTSRACPSCRADLQNLPPQDRCYFIHRPAAAEAAPPASAMVPDSSPAQEVEVVESHLETMLPETSFSDSQDVSLCEALDRILNKGAVLFGEVMISVADIDLVYLGLQVILASLETARGLKPGLGEGQLALNLFNKGVC
jgi:gas vesicle structural protein